MAAEILSGVMAKLFWMADRGYVQISAKIEVGRGGADTWWTIFLKIFPGTSEHVGGGEWEKVPPYPWLLISRLQPILRRRNVKKMK
jgi:hypothetical protein